MLLALGTGGFAEKELRSGFDLGDWGRESEGFRSNCFDARKEHRSGGDDVVVVIVVIV